MHVGAARALVHRSIPPLPPPRTAPALSALTHTPTAHTPHLRGDERQQRGASRQRGEVPAGLKRGGRHNVIQLFKKLKMLAISLPPIGRPLKPGFLRQLAARLAHTHPSLVPTRAKTMQSSSGPPIKKL